MSVSQSLNKFSFTNPSVGQIAPSRARPRSSTIGDLPRPRSATKRVLSHGAHDTPLMVHTMHHRMARSAPCLPRHAGRHRTQTLLANGLKSHTMSNVKPKPRARVPATRTATKHPATSLGHVKTADHSFKAPESDKPPPELHTHATALLAPIKIQKLAQQWAAKAIKSASKTRTTHKTHKAHAPGHTGINTTEHVYSFKEPEDKPELEIQNAVGGAALTSNTPTALSSHMDPRLLQAASGIQGTGLMGAQMSGVQDSEIPLDGQETPNSADPTKFDAAALATHPEQIGEGEEEEEGEEERVPSDPMKARLIGENLYNQQPGYDPLQDQYHMSAPLLDHGNPEHMFYQQQIPSRYPQNHKSYYHMQNPDRYNFTKAVQNYDRASHNDGMYCYSCIMFFGVLMIGVGIIMIIVELFDLFGRHKDMPLAIAGGGVLGLGVIVLASAMLLWRRRRTNIKKKAAHV